MGVLALADQIIATTWGYDQLLPENISVVNETRHYPIAEDVKKKWGGESAVKQEVEEVKQWAYTFRFKYMDCNHVTIAGEFNSWDANKLSMHR